MHGLLSNNNKREPQKFLMYSITPSKPAPACQVAVHLNPHTKSFNLNLAVELGWDFHYSETENINYHQICHYLPIPPHIPISPISPFLPPASKMRSSDLQSRLWFYSKRRGAGCVHLFEVIKTRR